MVKPIQNRRADAKTLDERLADKFDLMQIAREEHNAALFDEFSKSIEILLKGTPRAYQEYNATKQSMVNDLNEQYQSIEAKVNNAPDALTRDHMGRSLLSNAEWTFRETLEEVLMELFEKYDLIPMASPPPADIRDATQEESEQYEEKHEPQPQPEPKKKPKLLKKTKETFQV